MICCPVAGRLLILMVFFFASGCAVESQQALSGMTRYTLEHDGLEREYFVFLPSSYDDSEPHPAAIFMHGYGGSATGTEAEVTNGLNRYAEEYGYVMIYPQSTWFMSEGPPDGRWEVSSWNHISDGFDKGPAGPICTADAESYPCPPECGTCGRCGWASCHDDVGFLEALVARFSSRFMIDADRVYVSGFSNGALMSNRIGCEASALFAAVALIGGRVEPGFECTPEVALPLLQVNGGQDQTVPYDGRASSSGYFYAPTEAIAREWNAGAACMSETTAWRPRVGRESLKCTVACAGTRHESIDCLWPEGDHRWPGTPGRRGSDGYCVTELQSASMPDQAICIAPDPGQDIWGSRLLFEFFDTHVRERH
jgi:polyhydroxybutyrate depolymerase